MVNKRRARKPETNPLPNPGPSILAEPPAVPKPSKSASFINKAILGALLLIAFSIGLMFYWTTADTRVLDIHNTPFPTRTIREHPTAGGVIILNVDYCKTKDIEGNLRMSFVSQSREIFLPTTKERGPKGCQKTEIPVLIPKDIPPDSYRIHFRVDYDINPLKKNIRQEFESQPVEVDEPKTDPGAKVQVPGV